MRNRLHYFGVAPLCNLRPDRALRVGRFVLPLCARCSGVVVGACVSGGLASSDFLARGLPIYIVILMIMPLAADGLLQYFGLARSTNPRRFVTGVLFGVAVGSLPRYDSIVNSALFRLVAHEREK
ncbi:MAG: DUF2085 domain-containing protein [Acidobacteriota bacterium]